MNDPNALLRAAEARFAAGDAAGARARLEQVLRLVPGHPQLLQFLAVLCRRQGDAAAALRAADAAHRAAPADARIADTLGNALSDLGRHADALAAYARAVALDPGFAEAVLHRADALDALGRTAEARAAYAALPGPEPLAAAAGLALRDGELDAAVDLLDRALAHDPGHAQAMRGRVRVAVERGEPDAAARLAAALVDRPGDPDLLLEALGVRADAAAAAAVERALAADPAWADGRRALALHRREVEGRDDWLGLHEAAVAAAPRDPAGWRALVALHAAVDDHRGAADAAGRAAAATGRPEFRAGAMGFLAAAGELDAAARLLADPAVAACVPPLALAKLRLRQRDPAAAEAVLAPLCQGVADPERWALRGVAWQAMGDARWEWLHGQQGLIQRLDLGIAPEAIAAVAALLRGLHAQARLRLGQSVRGGTQTTGNLFARVEPELRALRRAIFAAAERYRAGLPPADPAHPLLRHRDAPLAMTASWSVRLPAGGFHVSHIHPKGVLSSASYWVLPPAEGTAEGTMAGWLELGRPPAYLALDLPPVATVEPAVGTLALFPSTLHHGTRPFGAGERITAAFDLAPRTG